MIYTTGVHILPPPHFFSQENMGFWKNPNTIVVFKSGDFLEITNFFRSNRSKKKRGGAVAHQKLCWQRVMCSPPPPTPGTVNPRMASLQPSLNTSISDWLTTESLEVGAICSFFHCFQFYLIIPKYIWEFWGIPSPLISPRNPRCIWGAEIYWKTLIRFHNLTIEPQQKIWMHTPPCYTLLSLKGVTLTNYCTVKHNLECSKLKRGWKSIVH